MFSNAIKYNSAHLASDTTGITKLVYEAALFLQEKLEGLLSVFSVHLADRIERARYVNLPSSAFFFFIHCFFHLSTHRRMLLRFCLYQISPCEEFLDTQISLPAIKFGY